MKTELSFELRFVLEGEKKVKEEIKKFINENKTRWEEVARYIWENPELGHQEFKSKKALVKLLIDLGFEVEEGIAGLETAFWAEAGDKETGPTIAFLAEYDALPEIGHACGHNLIGVMSVAAAASLKNVLPPDAGRIVVIGTPAEETDGGKVTMVRSGTFSDVDIALMAHPSSVYEKSGGSLALEAVQFDFFGRSSHASASPEKGLNALDALINMYNGISNLRQQVPDGIRIHGIISRGGEAANMIPEHTQARYYLRAPKLEQLSELKEKVIKCAEGGALAAGCRVEVSNYEMGYAPLNSNEELNSIFTKNLIEMGVSSGEIEGGTVGGSVDIGDVSQVVPAIHPSIKIMDEAKPGHTREFAQAANSPRGMEGMLLGATVLAYTGYDYLTNPEVRDKVRKEFEENKNQ